MTSQGLDFMSIRKRIDSMIDLHSHLIKVNLINDKEKFNRINIEMLPRLTNMIINLEYNEVIFRPDLEFLCELEDMVIDIAWKMMQKE